MFTAHPLPHRRPHPRRVREIRAQVGVHDQRRRVGGAVGGVVPAPEIEAGRINFLLAAGNSAASLSKWVNLILPCFASTIANAPGNPPVPRISASFCRPTKYRSGAVLAEHARQDLRGPRGRRDVAARSSAVVPRASCAGRRPGSARCRAADRRSDESPRRGCEPRPRVAAPQRSAVRCRCCRRTCATGWGRSKRQRSSAWARSAYPRCAPAVIVPRTTSQRPAEIRAPRRRSTRPARS